MPGQTLISRHRCLRAKFQLEKFTTMASTPVANKRVAIVGAGISGLLAHRELLKGSCSPVVFEASQPGGLWNAEHGRMWDSLRTNLSKYTCVVSDLDWPGNTDDFPTKNNVGSYISELSDSMHILSNSKVTNIEQLGFMDDATRKYKICYENTVSKVTAEEIFDDVIISSGFFTKSSTPNVDTSEFCGKIIGSHEYRNSDSFRDRKVIVVGGSFSGCEIAAEVAKVATEVHHIVSSHAYVLPTFLPEDVKNPATAFLPIDTVLYKLSDNRLQQIEHVLSSENSPDIKVESVLKFPPEDAATHKYFESVIGPNNDVFHQIGCPKLQKARVVISNEYRRMVKSGKIKMHYGKLKKIKDSEFEMVSTIGDQESETKVIDVSIDDCILATGFQPDLSIFSEDIQRILGISAGLPIADTEFLPFLLDREIMHPDLPGMYFVGMYKGPYFGVIELQSKLVAGYISGSIPLPCRESMMEGVNRAIQIREQRPRPHFPHPDYIGMMFDYARDLGKVPSVEFRNLHRYITPHYFSGRENAVISMEKDIENARMKGKYVAKFVFEALENETWSFNRIINDRKNNSVMQVAGKVSFTRIDPEGKYLLYREEGKLRMPNGYEFDTSHYYVYHYNIDQDTLDIFFSTVGKPEVIDRPFISMGFSPTLEGWESKTYHLCGCDNYNAKYFFKFQGLSIPIFEVFFDVEGPQKDYQATTKLERVIENSL